MQKCVYVRGKPGNFQHQFILKETFNMLSAGGASRQRGRQISRHRQTGWRMSACLCTRPFSRSRQRPLLFALPACYAEVQLLFPLVLLPGLLVALRQNIVIRRFFVYFLNQASYQSQQNYSRNPSC